jgi:hypothetical protein
MNGTKPKHTSSIKPRRKLLTNDRINKIFRGMLKRNLNYDYDAERRINEDGIIIYNQRSEF